MVVLDWHGILLNGLCDVKLSLLFVQNDNSTQNVTVPVANEIYENCSLTMNVTSVRYKTIDFYNGSEILNKNKKLSEDLYPQIITTTTTTTTTTTIREIYNNNSSSNNYFKKSYINHGLHYSSNRE